MDVRLWNIRCASHVANLVVVVALAGETIPSPVDNCDLVAALVRWFKYIVPQYVEELNSSLRSFLLTTLRIHVGRPDDSHIPLADLRQRSSDLQRLYGKDTVPDEMLELFNRGLGVWIHVVDVEGVGEMCVQKAFKLLSSKVLLQQERPQPTRFWHFASCARTLLLMRLLEIPKAALQVSAVKPSAENADRLGKF